MGRFRRSWRRGGLARVVAIGAGVAPATAGPLIEEFSAGLTGTPGLHLTVGPDGNVWFTESQPSRSGASPRRG
jgi:hypothetical protein